MKFTKYVSLCVMVCASMEVNAGDFHHDVLPPETMLLGSSRIIPEFVPFRERQEGENAVVYQKEKKEYEKHQNKIMRDANRVKEEALQKLKAENQAKLDKAERERIAAEYEASRPAREAEALRKQEETECRRIEKEKKRAEKVALAIAAQKAEEDRLRKEKENEARKRIESGEFVEKITINDGEKSHCIYSGAYYGLGEMETFGQILTDEAINTTVPLDSWKITERLEIERAEVIKKLAKLKRAGKLFEEKTDEDEAGSVENLGPLANQLISKPGEGILSEDVFVKTNRILVALGGILVLEEFAKGIYCIPIQARVSAACLWCNGVNIVFGKPVVKSPVRNIGRGAAIASVVSGFSLLGSCLRVDGGCFDSDVIGSHRRLFLGCCILGGLVKPVLSYVNAQIHSKNYDPSGLVIGALIGLALLDSSLFSHENQYSNMEHVFSLAAVGDFARLLIDEF